MLGTAAWLCLAGLGSSQPVLHAASPAALDQPCRIQQRTPLYVGLARGTSLESFEDSALASRNIVREVKQWACGASTSISVAVPSMQLAFARSAPIRLERLQFDDEAHAHVVLSSFAEGHGESLHWRVDLTEIPEVGWSVSHTGVASAGDLEVP